MTFRHLETLHTINREGSFANAAIELHTNRSNIKRICDSLTSEFGRPIFQDEKSRDDLVPTHFGQTLLNESGPLMRSIIHLGDGIRELQRKGRILRFATSDDFFHDGAFSIILSRIDVVDSFRPCYLRLAADRFKAALLNSECDVYFGAGLTTSSRLELIHLDHLPWSFHPGKNYNAAPPKTPADLLPGKWCVRSIGDPDATRNLIKELEKAGATQGRTLKEGNSIGDDEILLKPEPSWMGLINSSTDWPMYYFSAVIKKQHPYAELIERIKLASKV